MKKHSQFQKSLSVLMLFLLLIQFSGCVSSRVLTVNELPVSSALNYVIRFQTAHYPIDSAVLTNGIFSGKLSSENPSHKRGTVNLYLSSDTSLKISSENVLSIPVSAIEKIKEVKPSAGKTLLLVSGLIVALVVVFINTYNLDFNPFPNGI
jgi:hypothetical protein